jgi:uncharacterized membrane protein
MQYLLVSITVFAWALGFFLEKILMSKMHPGHFQIIATITALGTLVPYTAWARSSGTPFPASWLTIAAAAGTFLILNIGNVALTAAYTHANNAGTITAISNGYIVPMVLLSVVFLGEKLNSTQYIGLALTLVGTILLVKN